MNQSYENYFIKRYAKEAMEIEEQFIFILDTNIENIEVKDMALLSQKCITLLILDKDKKFYLYSPYATSEKYQLIPLPSAENPLVYQASQRGKKQFAYTHQTLALLYEKKVKLFKQDDSNNSIIIDFISQPKKIVAKDGQFYLLLATEKVAVIKDALLVEDDADIDIKEMFEYKEERLTYDIDMRTIGLDCFGNLWLLSNEDEQIYHFIDTKHYKASKSFTHIFNSFDNNTVWSNLYIDALLPQGCMMELQVTVGGVSQTFTNLSNILLYGYKGQKLRVDITLHSDSTRRFTPTIHAIRVIFNQKPYVEYLPAYYQKDNEVLSRYLSIFQDIMGDVELQIEKSAELLDPFLCDDAYLEWLSSLLGIARDYRWEEEKWRTFLAKTSALYKGLGTKEAMQEAIYLYCDEKPQIDERIGGDPWEFCVRLSGDKTQNSRDIEVIESIIEAFKPAHTRGRLYIDYGLSEKTKFIVGESVLPYNTEIK